MQFHPVQVENWLNPEMLLTWENALEIKNLLLKEQLEFLLPVLFYNFIYTHGYTDIIATKTTAIIEREIMEKGIHVVIEDFIKMVEAD